MSGSTRTTIAAIAVALLATALLSAALRTGQTAHREQQELLSEVAQINHGIDIAVLQVKTLLRSDYDAITVFQLAIRDKLSLLSQIDGTGDLARALRSKASLIERFKGQHAIFRNSLKAMSRLHGRLNGSTAYQTVAPELRAAQTELQWLVLESSVFGSHESINSIPAAMAQVQEHPDFVSFAETQEWRYLAIHIDKLIELTPDLNDSFAQINAVPINQTIELIARQAGTAHAVQVFKSRIALYGLFTLAVVLLLVAIYKAWQVWRYQVDLERRVEERTDKLTNANAQLRHEMDEKIRAQQELAQARKLESVGQLSAGIAHEINTPSQFVGDNIHYIQESFADFERLFEKHQTLLDVLSDAKLEPEVRRAVDDLQSCATEIDLPYLREDLPSAISQALDGVTRISTIVRAMKEFSHPGSDCKEHIDLNKAIESTITVARNEWKYVAEVVTSLDASLPAVPCLPGEINQTVLNMIVNSAHAIQEQQSTDDDTSKGTITVGTRVAAEHAIIEIRDTGSGIPQEHIDRIFDPFYTTKEVGKGTGQGLAIAYAAIVDKHGGKLAVESEPGIGTCFTIQLPLEQPDEEPRNDLRRAS